MQSGPPGGRGTSSTVREGSFTVHFEPSLTVGLMPRPDNTAQRRRARSVHQASETIQIVVTIAACHLVIFPRGSLTVSTWLREL